MFHNFYYLHSDMVLGVENSLPWIFDAISSGKRCPTSMFFLLTYIEFRTAEFFPPAEFWLINPNFRPGSRLQGSVWSVIRMKAHCLWVVCFWRHYGPSMQLVKKRERKEIVQIRLNCRFSHDVTKAKLQNYWSSRYNTSMMYKSSRKLVSIQIFAPNGFLVLW